MKRNDIIQYNKFTTPREANLWANKYKAHFPSDSDNDTVFLEAINLYTASAYPLFNNYLRYNKPLDPDYALYIRSMIEKIPTYNIPDNIVVYRYISKLALEEMSESHHPRKNTILKDKGFMSTTLIRESVDNYQPERTRNILLEISVPSGTKGTYIGLLKNTLSEYEIILAPNTKLRIDDKMIFNKRIWCTVCNT